MEIRTGTVIVASIIAAGNVTDLLFPDIIYDPRNDVIITVDKECHYIR